MVYREPADISAQGDRSDPSRPALFRLDASGAPGRSGRDGYSGGAATGLSPRGNDGTAGEAGEKGADGAIVALKLASVEGEPLVAMLSARVRCSGKPDETVGVRLDLREQGLIEIIANGGAGGGGGRGGRGSDGFMGLSGGDGGDGANGADGGNGGTVIITCDERDTHLLLLVQTETRAGTGGAAGASGKGGKASAFLDDTSLDLYDQPRREPRDGRKGRDGHRGLDGKSGSTMFEVRDELGISIPYEGRYDIALVGYQQLDSNDDGIYEPGEVVRLAQLTVKNTGKMPTPRHHPLYIVATDGEWTDAEQQEPLVLPRSIPPGKSHTFEQVALSYKLRSRAPVTEGQLNAWKTSVQLCCVVPSANRRIAAFERGRDFKSQEYVVQFPITVSAFNTRRTVKPGEAMAVRFALTNTSFAPIGRDTEGGRLLQVRLRLLSGTLIASEIALFDGAGRRVPANDGAVIDIPALPAQSTKSFECYVAVAPYAKSAVVGKFELSAEVGFLDDPKTPQSIALRTFELSVIGAIQRVSASNDSSVLLLTNNNTESAEVTAWEQLFASLGLSATIRDVESFEAQWELTSVPYTMIVVCDYDFDTPTGSMPVHALLSAQDWQSVATKRAVLFVGGDSSVWRKFVRAEQAPQGEPVSQWTTPLAAELKRAALVKVAQELHTKMRSESEDAEPIVVIDHDLTLEENYLGVRKYHLGTISSIYSMNFFESRFNVLLYGDFSAHDPAFVSSYSTQAQFVEALPFASKLTLLFESHLPFTTNTDRHEPNAKVDVIVRAIVLELIDELVQWSERPWVERTTLRWIEKFRYLDTMILTGAESVQQRANVHANARLREIALWLELLAQCCTNTQVDPPLLKLAEQREAFAEIYRTARHAKLLSSLRKEPQSSALDAATLATVLADCRPSNVCVTALLNHLHKGCDRSRFVDGRALIRSLKIVDRPFIERGADKEATDVLLRAAYERHRVLRSTSARKDLTYASLTEKAEKIRQAELDALRGASRIEGTLGIFGDERKPKS